MTNEVMMVCKDIVVTGRRELISLPGNSEGFVEKVILELCNELVVLTWDSAAYWDRERKVRVL